MKLDRIAIALASVAGLLLIAGPALADEAPAPGQQRAEFCKQNPQKCEEARAKREAFCKQKPETCAQMKEKRAERRELCQQNPEKCAQQRERMKERRADMQAKCAADPAKCEQMKQERRERFQKRHGGVTPPAKASPGETPPSE